MRAAPRPVAEPAARNERSARLLTKGTLISMYTFLPGNLSNSSELELESVLDC